MPAVWLRFRAELRTRWRALLAVALLVGFAGGAALAALAGARRTDTAFERFVKKSNAWDVLVNPNEGSESAIDPQDIAALPQVKTVGHVDGIFLGPAEATSFGDFFNFANVLASDGKVGYTFSRPKLIHGRMPNPHRADEVLLNPRLADQRGWHVGDRVKLLALKAEDVSFFDSGDYSFKEITRLIKEGKVGTVAPATVTGIGTFPDEVVVDEGFDVPQMLLTPAFLKRYPDTGVGYWGEVLQLRRGARDLPAFRRGVQALIPPPTPPKTKPEAIAFQTLPKTKTKVERAARPAVGALTIFAIVIALTGLLVIGQALARQSFLDASDNDTLHALGATRTQLFGTAMLRAAVIALVGAFVAVVLALLASPLTPIGVARTAEPDPGFDAPWGILGLGFVVTALVVLALAAWPAWRSARSGATDVVARPSRVVNAVAEVGGSVSAAAGIRMALEPGRGRTAVPVRTTIVGAGLAIATVVAAGVFASSLHHLVSTPRLFGWNWDTEMSINAQEAQPDPTSNARAEVRQLLESSPQVARWGTVSLSDITVDDSALTAVGVDPKAGAALPTLVDGKLPRTAGEIALGALTKRQLGVGTGDSVKATDINGKPVRLTVVGTVILPGLGTYPGADKTSLGEGAVVTRDQLLELGPDFGRDDFVVAFADSATPGQREAVLSKAQAIAESVDPEGFGTEGIQRPSDIVAYNRVRSTPLVLALVLALLASATVAHALVSAVRRRRRDLAMLATLGLTRRQISSTVAWQSTTVGVLALVIGIPLGVIGGRWAWGLLADDLGTLSEPKVPILAIAIGIPVVLLLCNAVAYIPGRIAARMKPAVVLRSE